MNHWDEHLYNSSTDVLHITFAIILTMPTWPVSQKFCYSANKRSITHEKMIKKKMVAFCCNSCLCSKGEKKRTLWTTAIACKKKASKFFFYVLFPFFIEIRQFALENEQSSRQFLRLGWRQFQELYLMRPRISRQKRQHEEKYSCPFPLSGRPLVNTWWPSRTNKRRHYFRICKIINDSRESAWLVLLYYESFSNKAIYFFPVFFNIHNKPVHLIFAKRIN